jgi:hypothetical protein
MDVKNMRSAVVAITHLIQLFVLELISLSLSSLLYFGLFF